MLAVRRAVVSARTALGRHGLAIRALSNDSDDLIVEYLQGEQKGQPRHTPTPCETKLDSCV